jgi:hypothetical protein
VSATGIPRAADAQNSFLLAHPSKLCCFIEIRDCPMQVDVTLERLSAVIGKIYDSAVDPALWPDALEAACSLIGATIGYIALFDTRKKTLRMLSYCGGDAEMIRSCERLVPFQPFWNVMDQYQIGEVAFTSGLLVKSGLTENDLENNTFFKEWARPYGLRDVVAGIVINGGGQIASVNLHTPLTRDLAGPHDLAVMDLLLPHLRRAITISNLLDMRSIAAAAFEATINTLTSAIVLVNGDAAILHSNHCAEAMFSAGGPILSQRGVLANPRGERHRRAPGRDRPRRGK